MWQITYLISPPDIFDEREVIRKRLRNLRDQLGTSRPLVGKEAERWEALLKTLREDEVASLNRQVDRFNLVVPMMRAQMFHFSLESEAKKILEEEVLRQRLQEAKEEEASNPNDEQKKEAVTLNDSLAGAMMKALQEVLNNIGNIRSKR